MIPPQQHSVLLETLEDGNQVTAKVILRKYEI